MVGGTLENLPRLGQFYYVGSESFGNNDSTSKSKVYVEQCWKTSVFVDLKSTSIVCWRPCILINVVDDPSATLEFNTVIQYQNVLVLQPHSPAPLSASGDESIIYIDQVNFHLTFLLGFYIPQRKTVKLEWIYIYSLHILSLQPTHGSNGTFWYFLDANPRWRDDTFVESHREKKLPSADNSKDQPGNFQHVRRTFQPSTFSKKLPKGN